MPSWETNCIDDWETKVTAIVEETIPRRYGGDFGYSFLGANVF